MLSDMTKILQAFDTYESEKSSKTGRNFSAPLQTEDRHEKTINLAENAQHNLTDAIKQCLAVDNELLETMKTTRLLKQIDALTDNLKAAMTQGKNIFLVGCGASGRLAMVALKICLETIGQEAKNIKVVMAGGDKALVSALEKFEDNPEYGQKQLTLAEFKPGDLVIGITVSGDAPFVKRTIDYANEQQETLPKEQQCKPILLIGNPVAQVIKRNPQHPITETDKVDVISAATGPAALSGSTRMQPSSALLMVLVSAIENALVPNANTIRDTLTRLQQSLQQQIAQSHLGQISDLIKAEATVYHNNERVYYEIQPKARHFAMSIFTDIVERSPTFTVPKIVPLNGDETDRATAYLFLSAADNAQTATTQLLGRAPFCLNWNHEAQTTATYFSRYDFSAAGKIKREINFKDKKPAHIFSIDIEEQVDGQTYFTFSWNHQKEQTLKLNITGLDRLEREILLKMYLNMHSTLVMGRNKKFSNNIMTRVNPTNAKLIGRAIKYAKFNVKQLQTKHFPKKQPLNLTDNFDESFKMHIRYKGNTVDGIDQILNLCALGLVCRRYPHYTKRQTTEMTMAAALVDPDYQLYYDEDAATSHQDLGCNF